MQDGTTKSGAAVEEKSFTVRSLPATDDGREWDAYVASSPLASHCHLSAWRRVIGTVFGHQAHYLFAERPGGRICGVLPLIRQNSRLFGDGLYSMPYLNYGGAIGDDMAIETALMAAAGGTAETLGSSAIEFRDNRARNGAWPVKTGKVAMLLKLPDDSSILEKTQGAKRRSQIRRPLREKPEVHKGGVELLEMFYPVFAENMRDLGTPVYSKAFFAAIFAAFPEHASIVAITLRGKPVSAAFLIGFRGVMQIPWASTLREVNPIGMNMLLYWEVLCLAIERGYRLFDFGRSTKDAGTYHFKRRWGAEAMPLYWHYWLAPGQAMPELNPDNPKYRLAIQCWQRLPLWLANRLGPAIVRNLP